MKSFWLIIVAVLLFTFSFSAQTMDSAKLEKQRNELKKLDFLIGTWEGTGWIMTGRERKNATVKESIQPKVGGLIYVVDGLGKSKNEKTGEETVVHEAYGVFYVDEKTIQLRFRFYKADGQIGDTAVQVSGKKVVWGFTAESGTEVRFTESINEKGEWMEIGEVFINEKWIKFFEMTLKKVK